MLADPCKGHRTSDEQADALALFQETRPESDFRLAAWFPFRGTVTR
jgi:hypothetical protein